MAGGGVLIDTLVHSIDIFRALAGEIVHVDAAVSTTLPVQVEDSASIQVVGANGAIGSLNCSWVTPVSEAEVRIYGTEGEAVVDYGRAGGLRYRLAGDQEWTELPFDTPDRFVRQAGHFLACVQSKQPTFGKWRRRHRRHACHRACLCVGAEKTINHQKAGYKHET